MLQADYEIVHAMIERYFHGKWLNDSLNIACPELPHLAEWIFHFLDSKVVGLKSVKIYDSPANHIYYSGNGLAGLSDVQK